MKLPIDVELIKLIKALTTFVNLSTIVVFVWGISQIIQAAN